MTRKLPCLFSVALLTMPVFASNRYLLPVKDSNGRSVLYFADHELKAVDAKAEYAVVMVHGVNGGREDCTGMVVAHKSAKNGEHPTRAGDYRELIRLIISAANDRPNRRGAM